MRRSIATSTNIDDRSSRGRRAALACLSRLADDTDSVERVRRWLGADRERRGSSWRLLEELRLVPLAATWCSRTGLAGELAEEERRWLRHRLEVNGLRQALLRRRAEELGGALAGHGIATVAIKGAWLAFSVYERPAMRVMDDLDLLVDRADFEPAREFLIGLGFEPHPFQLARDYSPHAAQLRRPDPDLPGDGFLNLDLHLSLFSSHPDDWCSRLLRQRRRPNDDGPTTYRPTADVALLVLAVHLLHHHLEPRFQATAVADAAALIRCRGGEIDWGWLRALAVEPLVAVPLHVLLELLGAPPLAPPELAVTCAETVRRAGAMARVRRLLALTAEMREVRPGDVSLASLGRRASAAGAARELLARLWSADRSAPWKRQRALVGDPAGGRLAGLAGWLRHLPDANWRFSAASFLVSRMQSSLGAPGEALRDAMGSEEER